MLSQLHEVVEDAQRILGERGGGLVDAVLPPLVFVALNALTGLQVALWGSLLLAAAFAARRLYQKQTLVYALGGMGGVLLPALLAWFFGRAESYFIPGIVTGAATVFVSLVSVLIGRPLFAWASHAARRWPRDWYWHERVRPAYSEVTLLWGGFFALRLAAQLVFFERADTALLALTGMLGGWPGQILLLVAGYLYGRRRLRALRGPSVEEYVAGAPPPWRGQRRGF